MKIKQLNFPSWEEFKKIRRSNRWYYNLNNTFNCAIEDMNYSKEKSETRFAMKHNLDSWNYLIDVRLNRVSNKNEYDNFCNEAQKAFEKWVIENFMEAKQCLSM